MMNVRQAEIAGFSRVFYHGNCAVTSQGGGSKAPKATLFQTESFNNQPQNASNERRSTGETRNKHHGSKINHECCKNIGGPRRVPMRITDMVGIMNNWNPFTSVRIIIPKSCRRRPNSAQGGGISSCRTAEND